MAANIKQLLFIALCVIPEQVSSCIQPKYWPCQLEHYLITLKKVYFEVYVIYFCRSHWSKCLTYTSPQY